VEVFPVRTEEDLEAVRGLWLAYYHFILDEYGIDMGREYFQAEMAALPGPYAPPEGHLFLARDEDAAAGSLALKRVTDEKGELKRLYVRPEYRGRGVGRALVTAALDAARRIGYRRIQVHTAPFLTEAVALYQGFGFREVAAEGEEEAPEMFMELELDEAS
jgi:GNAT superfamily N-acetyltransferase